MTISERIAKLIDVLRIKKTDFAAALKVTSAYISKIINKGAIPSDRLIEDICEKFNVNETWLRTGEGEMFVELDPEDELMQWAGTVLATKPDDFRKRFVRMLSQMSDDEWEWVEEKLLQLFAESSDNP